MAKIKIGIIGGTGLGDALGAEDGHRYGLSTPFGDPSSQILETKWAGIELAILQRHGEGHRYNPSTVPYRANIFALKQIGCTHVLASGATGSLRKRIKPRDLVIADQIIDKTHQRASTFYEHAAVHVEFADPFCPVMRGWLLDAAGITANVLANVHTTGTYICMAGPSFSTRAESRLYRQWGADVVGMTALPEARLAREAEMAYALIALPTDYDCWRERPPGQATESLLEEIIGNLQRASAASIALIKAALAAPDVLLAQPSLAHDALALAIWSHKDAIAAEEVERLDALWGRYFA
jgi:5'-methylthioadenosine phosphorylase